MKSVLKKKLTMLYSNLEKTKLQTLLNPGLSIKTNQNQIMNATSSSVNPTVIVYFFFDTDSIYLVTTTPPTVFSISPFLSVLRALLNDCQ